MKAGTFDQLTRKLGAKVTRRTAMAAAGAGAFALATSGSRAQEASPVPTRGYELLFVQTAKEATITPNGDGTVEILLAGIGVQTQYFADRPDRIAGLLDTEAFAAAFESVFADSLPNASLVGRLQGQDADFAVVVTAGSPVFDASAGTLTYTATLLEAEDIADRTFESEVVTALDAPVTLTDAAFFIDGVEDLQWCIYCAYIAMTGILAPVGALCGIICDIVVIST